MIKDIVKQLNTSRNTAFVIKDQKYSYSELAILVKKYYSYLVRHPQIKLIGITMRNDLDTYALITATFLSDCGYVIFNLAHPIERNTTIALEAGLEVLFSSEANDVTKVPPPPHIFTSPNDSSSSPQR